MPDGVYEQDALTWADTQPGLLRRRPVSELVDWSSVIKEISDVGLSDLRACRGLLLQAVRHFLKLHAWPQSSAARHWRQETTAILVDARRGYTASMRQRLMLDEIYADALAVVMTSDDASGAPQPLPDECPFTIAELLDADVGALLATSGGTTPGTRG